MYVCIVHSASNFSFIGLFICLGQFIVDINFTRDSAPTPSSAILT